MGEEKHDGLSIPGRVVLAHEPPFTVGIVRVDPATRQVESKSRSETLEPRVMQVFVALARANGRIVTRDELTAWCWDGRIVGEDAINRAIFRLRQIAAEIGDASFAIETITKVGYRLVAKVQRLHPDVDREPVNGAKPSAEGGPSRRGLIAGAAASVAGLAAAGLLWRKPWRHQPDPEAVKLVRQGDIAQKTGRPGDTRQAVTYFERAVRVDPQYGAAWGGLALSYTHSLDGFSEAQLASLPARIRSAAARALELDPDNVDAQLALACILPYFRNWQRMEPELRRIRDRYPDHWLANGRLAILYYQVSRFTDGAALHRHVIAMDPMISPGPYAFAATALSNAGQIQEADALLDEGRDRWPANPLLWFAGYKHLLFSGRPGSAAAMVMDPEAIPSGLRGADLEPLLTLARAVDRKRPDDVNAAIRDALDESRADIQSMYDAAPSLALLGRPDLSFEGLNRYYFNRGTFGAPTPIGPYTRRYTDFLFSMPMASARTDPRFAQLTREIGLDAYWASRGTPPQYT